MNKITKYILAAIGIILAYAVGAWLYQKGSQILFNQTIHESEYRGIVITSFLLYLFIMVPAIFLGAYAINRATINVALKWLLTIIVSILVGLFFPFLASGGQITSPEGKLLLCFFIPPAFILGIIYNLLFSKKIQQTQ
ncbi:hypothetical protein [Paenibacillus sp. TY11]|uniref:hypothetical protein n=1 Tax=Paenibacillus sp. TY11 TaxID=3448633 RepID=UPI0040394F05